MAVDNDLSAHSWDPQPQAAELIDELVAPFLSQNVDIARLGERMQTETGTRLIDWVDAICVASDEHDLADRLTAAGFRQHSEGDGRSDPGNRWWHPLGLFPSIEFCQPSPSTAGSSSAWLAIRVQSIEDFLASNQWTSTAPIVGKPGSRGRRAVVKHRPPHALRLLEQRGSRNQEFTPTATDENVAAAMKIQQQFLRRNRGSTMELEDFRLADRSVKAAIAEIGVDWTCELFFAEERRYWMMRNDAARVQYERQQTLGLGWANHDHHTYRSSREFFHLLVDVLERMGLECRERFYAGQEAGWGAQVMESPQTGIVVFADVDLSPAEISGDFAHEPLQPRDALGTVGLWCALHGESFLRAGMHHLECQFDFDAARQQLATAGVMTMAPFTDFPHLKQAFTQGQIWPVDEDRISRLLSAGQISVQQADRFRSEGALGSHLEILERNDGYKGFNQTGVSDIIGRTDPRRN